MATQQATRKRRAMPPSLQPRTAAEPRQPAGNLSRPNRTKSNNTEQIRTPRTRPTPFFRSDQPGKKVRRKPEIRLQCSAHSAHSARTDRTMPNKTEQPERPITSETREISLPERSKTLSPEHPNEHASCSPRAPERTRNDLKKPETTGAQPNAGSTSLTTLSYIDCWSYPTSLSVIVVAPASTYFWMSAMHWSGVPMATQRLSIGSLYVVV